MFILTWICLVGLCVQTLVGIVKNTNMDLTSADLLHKCTWPVRLGLSQFDNAEFSQGFPHACQGSKHLRHHLLHLRVNFSSQLDLKAKLGSNSHFNGGRDSPTHLILRHQTPDTQMTFP